MSPQARVFLIFSLGYFASYAFRGVNLVLAPLLSRDIGVDPAGLGMLTSVYFLAFAGFQLPAGMLLDRFGPRRVEAGLLLVAAAGAAVFAVGRDLGALMIGRALIGIGVSACLTAAIKAITLWYPPDRLADDLRRPHNLHCRSRRPPSPRRAGASQLARGVELRRAMAGHSPHPEQPPVLGRGHVHRPQQRRLPRRAGPLGRPLHARGRGARRA